MPTTHMGRGATSGHYSRRVQALHRRISSLHGIAYSLQCQDGAEQIGRTDIGLCSVTKPMSIGGAHSTKARTREGEKENVATRKSGHSGRWRAEGRESGVDLVYGAWPRLVLDWAKVRGSDQPRRPGSDARDRTDTTGLGGLKRKGEKREKGGCVPGIVVSPPIPGRERHGRANGRRRLWGSPTGPPTLFASGISRKRLEDAGGRGGSAKG